MTSRRTRVLLLAVGLLLVVAGCSSTGGDAETPDVTSAEATDASSTTAPPATQQTTATEQATTTLARQVEPLLTGANPLIQITPTEGVGLRPMLSWEAIEGAGSYFLVVKDDAGSPYWAWDGAETSVPLGGALFPEDIGNGPTIAQGYTWSVSAYAADGTILAISGDRSLSP
jgi:hypothetical protein